MNQIIDMEETKKSKKQKHKALKMDAGNCKPLREVVFETIRNAIVNGEFKPGERLMEVQLAEELGVSRTPVRESIRKLELEGLVRMVPRKGAYVTPMSILDLREMMQIRGALEGLAAELAAKNATEDEVRAMEEANRGFESSALTNNEDGIINYDIQFHELIYEAGRNEKLTHMINSLREQMQRVRVEYVEHINDKTPLTGQHQAIIESIRTHRGHAASEAAAEHIRTTEKDMIVVLKGND